MDLMTLKTELAKPVYTGLTDQAAADLMNTPGAIGFRSDLGIREVIGAIAPADFVAMTVAQIAKIQLIFSGSSTVDATNANTRTIFLGIFAGMPTTIANLTALAQTPGPSVATLTFGATVSAAAVHYVRSLP